MPFTADTLNRLKPVEIDGITILTNEYEHRLTDKGHIYAHFKLKEPSLLAFLKEKGYTVANYALRADYESGAYSNWALLNKDNNPVLENVADYSCYALERIRAYAVKHYGYKPESS